MKFSRDHLCVCVHLDCFRGHEYFNEDYGLCNVVQGIGKQHYSRDPEVSYNFIALTVLSFRHETE